MTQADIEPVNMAATDAGVAFAAKQVDAAVTWEPALSQGAKSEHGHILLTSADKPGLITDVVAATTDTIANEEGGHRGLRAGLVQGARLHQDKSG